MPSHNTNRRKHSNLADYFPEERIIVTSGIMLAIVTILTFFSPSLLGSALAPIIAFTPLAAATPKDGSLFAWAVIVGMMIVGVVLLYHFLRRTASPTA